MEDLKSRRNTIGISQIELAKKIGVSTLTVQWWEYGVITPTSKNREKLEQALIELENEKLEKLQAQKEKREDI